MRPDGRTYSALFLRLSSPRRGEGAHLHVNAAARAVLPLDGTRFGVAGRILRLDLGAADELARATRRAGGASTTGDVLVAVALHELMHALLGTVAWRDYADAELRAAGGRDRAPSAFAEFSAAFPTPGPAEPTEGAILEEALLLSLALENRAMAELRWLFDPGAAAAAVATLAAAGRTATSRVAPPPTRALRTGGGAGGAASIGAADGGPAEEPFTERGESADPPKSLFDLLTLPMRRHPDSLRAQLREALSSWRGLLAEGSDAVLLAALRALDAVAEEENVAGPPGPGPVAPPRWHGAAVLGDEGERFAAEEPWMRTAVMVAKNVPVWLAQVSRRVGHEVKRLDEIPDDELAAIARDGFDTLWLVGIWERSAASLAIKSAQGIPADLGSAYAVHDHVVAAGLGGEAALASLRASAERHGIRLAADMVANHTALDSRWIEEHPDWFVQSAASPFPSYSFTGPDLSPGRPFAVRVEDGYLDGSDAAVVFQLVDRSTGRARYVFHGNDGTGLPWNDTAQLDLLRADVRQGVIDELVAVASKVAALRLDAAMTLVRRHVRRIWHPAPGEGGAVASRGALAIGQAEFDSLMPREFWLDAVEAVSERAPGTMLVAEAFWLLEEAFVSLLGMHRVYNSGFMQQLAEGRDEELRLWLQESARRSPRVLERYVNYLTTPDETPAAVTFGKGDRYFGAATLLATLPGTPLFGHGQAEGLLEEYGMEFARPREDEVPDQGFRERHRREIAPLLRRRGRFAGAVDLVVLRAAGDDGALLPHVHAYARSGSEHGRPALVAFNHSDAAMEVTLVGPEGPVWEAMGLQLPSDAQAFVADRHPDGDMVELRRSDLLGGLKLSLGPFQTVVWLEARIENAAVPAPVGDGRGGRKSLPYGLSRFAAGRRARWRRRRGAIGGG